MNQTVDYPAAFLLALGRLLDQSSGAEPTEEARASSMIDLMATLAAQLNFDLPEDAAEDSHDLLPLLRGETQSVRSAHVHNTREDQYAIRSGDWLLVDAKTG